MSDDQKPRNPEKPSELSRIEKEVADLKDYKLRLLTRLQDSVVTTEHLSARLSELRSTTRKLLEENKALRDSLQKKPENPPLRESDASSPESEIPSLDSKDRDQE